MKRRFSRRAIVILLTFLGATLAPMAIQADTTTTNTSYGVGDYGTCSYETCPITLSSSGAVSIDISTPTPSGSCTVQSDSVSVLTSNSAGYTLQVANSSTNTAMTSGANSIPASSGTSASPTALNANAWGYRVDSYGGFGSGPTSAQSGISAPISSFAGVPASNATPATIANTSVAANPAVTTTVWYALCANSALSSGTYTTTVTYTATTN